MTIYKRNDRRTTRAAAPPTRCQTRAMPQMPQLLSKKPRVKVEAVRTFEFSATTKLGAKPRSEPRHLRAALGRISRGVFLISLRIPEAVATAMAVPQCNVENALSGDGAGITAAGREGGYEEQRERETKLSTLQERSSESQLKLLLRLLEPLPTQVALDKR